jgi:hypothetical protein
LDRWKKWFFLIISNEKWKKNGRKIEGKIEKRGKKGKIKNFEKLKKQKNKR